MEPNFLEKIKNMKKRLYLENLKLLSLKKITGSYIKKVCISRVHFSRFGLLQIEISDKFSLGHNPLGIVNHIGFINVKKLIIG